MGTCAATVWNSDRHGFAATLGYRGMSTATYGFDTIENAQAWCVTQLAELRVSGKCGNEKQASDGGTYDHSNL